MASEDADFTDEFCRFLQEIVPSVEAAELLLLLARARAPGALPKPWPSSAPAALRQKRRITWRRFAAGLVGVQADGRALYRPAAEGVAAHARTLEKVYRERPVTPIRVIYGLRDSKIRCFAAAFKLRRK